MKKICYLAALCALACTPSAHAAGPAPQEQVTVPAPQQSARIALQDGHHRMLPADYSDYLRVYTLSNGSTLTMYRDRYSVYAQLQDGAPHQLAVNPDHSFVALDRQIQLHLRLQPDQEIHGHVLLMLPAAGIAANGAGVQQLLVATLR